MVMKERMHSIQVAPLGPIEEQPQAVDQGFDLGGDHCWPALPPVRLARIPAQAQVRYQGDRWSYLEAGPRHGAPLLLLHGIGADAQYFRFQLAGLSARWRVIAWNAPGYGLSDPLRTDQPQASDYAQAVCDFMEALDIGPCVVAGNSFGSAVAQAFAIAHPQRVRALLLSGTGIGQRELSPQRRAAFEERVTRIRKGTYQYGDRGADHLVGPQASQALRNWLTELSRGLHIRGLENAAAFRLSAFCSLDHAQALTLPVLMVQGSEDRVNPRQDNADRLLQALPQARMQLWQGIGHLPEVEAPGLFNQTLSSFAQTLEAP
jgi:pimeloyl-ACP methyl ester carboxylesterase